ncbi:tetratricopeptide repeat protein [Sphingomonas sp. Leaf22]|uniref:tetratricopeptide repeat protein n=1 Tax=Sphingomonas sp. Leaf22 TaxID=1735687 RepID=UPI00138F7B87|nr:tetratricopeptide repeat protein [Sphingomonas sp. Leaf22]
MTEYDQLAGFLAADPANVALLTDTAHAAIAAGRPAEARALIERLCAIEGPSPVIDHLTGLAAMAARDWAGAATAFRTLTGAGVDAPGVRYNLARSLAMQGETDEALVLLDDDLAAELPQAAQLLIGLLHDRGEMDRAETVARIAFDRFPDHAGVNAVISTLAIDLEDLDLARAAAGRAGDHPEALVTQATLAMEDNDPAAGALFDRVLAMQPDHPRARVGRGLLALSGQDAAAATADLDRGAEGFGSHLGSWIAAGWAHLLAGDAATARLRFDRALAIDDGFAEGHGSLAVLDLLAGDLDAARRRTAVALRLDRESFAGGLAAAMLAAGDGDAAKAERIVTLALSTPLDDRGTTIAQALARMGGRG